MGNDELRGVYDIMHQQGVTAWFSDGQEERDTILKFGKPWDDKVVLEIGCGEGDLSSMIYDSGGAVQGIDYSAEAIKRAQEKYPKLQLVQDDYHLKNFVHVGLKYDRIVMQGVLEHLDSPFTELKWMIDNLLVKGGDIITSSPCFLNPRGIIWHTLWMLGAVMSKTDLHFLDPDQFEDFCKEHGYRLDLRDCDVSWGNRDLMIKDLAQRIPLALRDGNIKYNPDSLSTFLTWLRKYKCDNFGATVVYKIQT